MNNVERTAAAIAEAGGPSNVAAGLRMSAQAVCFWRDGARKMPTEHGATLEKLSPINGKRWLIWPEDWHRIWPELVGAEGAPEAPCDGGVVPSADRPAKSTRQPAPAYADGPSSGLDNSDVPRGRTVREAMPPYGSRRASDHADLVAVVGDDDQVEEVVDAVARLTGKAA